MHSDMTNVLPLKQPDQLYRMGQEKLAEQGIAPFSDIHDYLQALEQEANLLIVMHYVRHMDHFDNEAKKNNFNELSLILQIPEYSATSEKITEKYQKLHEMNHQRASVSEDDNISLIFNDLCNEHNLSEFERNTLMILLMLHTSKDFRRLFKICGYEEYKDENREDSLKIGTLLMILCRDFRDQLSSRYYFSLDGKLVSEELIIFLSRVNEMTNILDARICINERTARYIMGDNNFYHHMFTHISRERGNVRLEQVVLPDSVKHDLLTHTENFLKNKKRDLLDKFFGYGTGLVFLFHGPSGTGKTMLAKALANHFNRQIFSLDSFNLNNIPVSWQKIFSNLFKEAALQNAIVFFDEADELFGPTSDLSRLILIELEKSRCITIFSTNKTIDLHPALERRIGMKIHFPFPDENIRHELWKRLLPDHITCSSDVDLRELAERYRFSGGMIKNTIFLAVNASLKANDDKKPSLTQSNLVHAAEIQSQSMMTDAHVCRTYYPPIGIAELPLGEQQKRDLYGIAMAYEKLKKERLGFNLLICTSDIDAGSEAVQGLASVCGLKIREYFYFSAMSDREHDEIRDPLSQRKISPLEYAFSGKTGDHVMTVFLDYGGYFRSSIEEGRDEHGIRSPRRLFFNMRHHENMFCLVTLPMKSPKLQFEFNHIVELEYPPEDMQIRCWKQYLTDGKVDNDKLKALIRQYPMHLSEIGFIGRHVSIQFMLRSNADKPAWKDIEEVICRHRKKQNVPLLFGNKD